MNITAMLIVFQRSIYFQIKTDFSNHNYYNPTENSTTNFSLFISKLGLHDSVPNYSGLPCQAEKVSKVKFLCSTLQITHLLT